MKKFIFMLLIIAIAIPAFAKDPRETKEYWVDKSHEEIGVELNQCWNKARTHFVVPVKSKQWNICCAILSARVWPFKGQTEKETSDAMIKYKKMYEE